MSRDDETRPHLVVATVVERDGRFLIIEENIGGRRMLNQPAGHHEAGETLIEAAVRETLEEAGWHVEPTHILGVYEWQSPFLAFPFVRVAYVARAVRHEPERELDDGIEQAMWLTPEELFAQEDRLRGPAVRRCIEDYLAGQRYPLSLVSSLEADF